MSKRAYSQTTRAERTEETRRAILDGFQWLFLEEGVFDPPLSAVAERAGTTTRTILRHFGSKRGLIAAAIEDATARVERSRSADPGDLDNAITRLVDHYEQTGEATMRLLAEAERNPLVARVVDDGKALHRDWVVHVFAPLLDRDERERERQLALLASVTDLYVWSLLRWRYGRSREETEAAIRGLADHATGRSG